MGKAARSIDDQSNLFDDGRVTCRKGENSRHHPGLLAEFVRRWRERETEDERASEQASVRSVGRSAGAPMRAAAAAAFAAATATAAAR